ncbi:hypothetical protein AAFG07_20855 [Bradyrhizobium sp. B097]|uniref:hypothetical protein n=1 Tax=Bradyrhizobium sp. B097 TaxID=3140244 RepID=UPI0031831F8E
MPLSLDQLRRQLGPVVRAIVADVERRVATEVVVARGVERLLTVIDGGEEIPSERQQRENAAAMAELQRLGNGPHAAMKLARRWSNDPHRQQMLAQHFRRLRRRARTKTSTARFPTKK